MTALRPPVHVSKGETARLIREAGGRVLHLRFGYRAVTLHPDCKWPIPLLAAWREGARA